MAFTFGDVDISFSEEEWNRLGEHQKKLYTYLSDKEGTSEPQETGLENIDEERHNEEFATKLGPHETLVLSKEKCLVYSKHEETNKRQNASQTKQVYPVGGKLIQSSKCEKTVRKRIHSTKQRKNTEEEAYRCSEFGNQDSALDDKMKTDLEQVLNTYPKSRMSFIQSAPCFKKKSLHTDDRRHPCSECGKRFRSSSQLIVHERIHTGEKPYRCPTCEKSFSDFSNLTVHKRTHTGEKPYLCPKCWKEFGHRCSAVKHLRMHASDKPNTVTECWKF